jgi:N-acyl-L-homoserine lactone synthetase
MDPVKPIHIEVGRYSIKSFFSSAEQDEIHQLRARVFCAELGWVGAPDDSHEVDEFDDNSDSIAVLDNDTGAVLATLRLTPPGVPWMLTTYFQGLLAREVNLRLDQAWEVTRLAIDKSARACSQGDDHTPADLLFQGLFHYCVLNDIRCLDMVVSRPVFRYLNRRGLLCESLSAFADMPDGATAGVAQLDWIHCIEQGGDLSTQKWFYASDWEAGAFQRKAAVAGAG